MSGPVIAVSGPPGAGKTTLARAAAARLGAACVEYDRYETFTRAPVERTRDWLRRGAPYGEIEAPGLREAVAEAAARGPVLFDTPLGRAHPQTGPLIEIAVWIDCPLDLALKRKLTQLAGTVPAGREGEFLVWMRGFLEAYETIVHPACTIQTERLSGTSDIVVAATAPVVQSVEMICQRALALRSRGGFPGRPGLAQ